MNIFIGNISYKVQEEELSSIFSEYGEIKSVKIIVDKFTGKSKGFGFVEMDDKGAKEAIEKLNNTEVGGRNLVVNEARPPKERNY